MPKACARVAAMMTVSITAPMVLQRKGGQLISTLKVRRSLAALRPAATCLWHAHLSPRCSPLHIPLHPANERHLACPPCRRSYPRWAHYSKVARTTSRPASRMPSEARSSSRTATPMSSAPRRLPASGPVERAPLRPRDERTPRIPSCVQATCCVLPHRPAAHPRPQQSVPG